MVRAFPEIPRVPWTVIVSIALHAAVAGLLALRISSPPVAIPIGVEWRYLNESPQNLIETRVQVPTPKKTTAAKSVSEKTPEARLVVAASVPAQPTPATSGAADGQIVSALERYKFELRLFLESRKLYPEIARRLQQTGTVIVQFRVNADGDLRDINIERASSSEILNRAALDLIRRASKFRPFPDGVALTELRLTLPIEYLL